ncbi:MAG: cell surface protein SprA, partial [Bacteroidota bacterium]
MKIRRSLLSFLSVIACFLYAFSSFGSGTQPDNPYASEYILVTDTLSTDTIPLKDRKDNWIYNQNNNPFDLKDPSAIEKEVEYDPSTGGYIISEKVGEDYYRAPTYMSFEEYMEHQSKEQEKSYFKSLSGVSTGGGGGGRVDPVDKIDIKKSLADRLFGGSKVDIRPQGNIDLTFGADFQKVQNPILTVRQQRQGGFDFDMNIQMNVTGSIGEKLKLNTSYNTQATFDFENQMKLEYDSDAFSEDDIIKDIEAGNVSFPLRSNLIQGSQNLFGFKIDTQWGKLKLSMVASQQRSRQQQLRLEGGSQLQEFEVRADQYDENRHFFLSYYNRESFSAGLENLPQIKSLFKINPGDIEVWVTNDRNDYTGNGVQDIVAIADLGEPTRLTNENPNFQAPAMPRFRDAFTGEGLPDNRANDIYEALLADPTLRSIDKAVASLTGPSFRFQQAKDFEKVSARLLSPSEYTFHPELGFISLNFNLRPDQVLGVSFRYDYNGKNYKVGELTKGDVPADTTQPPPVIFVKMLKSTTTRVDLPYWDLMMKNVYSLGAFQISQEDFRLDIFYNDPQRSDIRFLPFTNLQGIPLLRVFNLDKLNVQGDPCPDGIFDFVPGLTIQPRNGRIMFPVLEPFGKDLVEGIDDVNLRDTFDFSVLYDSTITWAREFQDLNRFVIRGEYKSSGNSGGSGREISLGSFNLPQGSVRVTAGGQALVEGQDYEVDYNIGRVTILNDALLNSGVPVNVSFEDNTLFGFQTKSLLGVRADYEISEDFNVGATYLKLFERPFTQKVNVGDDPINNNMYGVDVNFTKDAPWLTRIVDGIPGIDTKEPSSLSFSAEAAFLQPGHSRAINQLTEDGEKDKRGVVYLDDFEGSTSSFDLRTPANKWVLASVPQGTPGSAQDLMFPEAKLIDSLAYGYNRAKLMWYRIDLSVGSDPRDDHYTVPIAQTEVFPNISLVPGFSNNIQTFDLTFRPSERGPYNFDLPLGQNDPAISAGITQQGRLAEPATRWGGIMRDLTVTDFEAANIEFIEFWMLNPFRNANGPDEGGDLYINLGNISEDILRDSRYFYENGIPTDGSGRTDDTNWSLIPRTQNVVNAFANNEADREIQDVGLDGQNDDGERVKFSEALDRYSGFLDPNVFSAIEADPANDNFVYFRDFPDGTSVLDRYSQFNNPQGNSQAPSANSRTVQSATNLPDSEDLNRDNTLNETEAYYQYRIPLRSVDDEDGTYTLNFNNPYVTDSIHGAQGRKWYRFKVPIDQPTSKIGGIQDFRAIRFIRMYLNNFEDDITLRFARLELARNQWRRYRRQLQVENGEIDQSGVELVTFDINDVNIEENSSRTPFGYIIPPGIQREQANNTAFANVLQNEQALAMEVCGLPRGTAKGIYKNINFDLRLYEELEMFVHAEAVQDPDLQNGDLALLLRLGSDFENNYYEYEVPLTISDTSNIPGYLEPEYKRRVWPVENDIVLPLKELTNLKLERNAASASLNNFFTKKDPRNDKNIMRIIGNPTLGPLKGMMIGVVNRDTMIANTHCAEIWVNELRVSGLDERGGMAAIGRLDLKLADFGDLTVAGELETIGFGGLEEKLQQRSRERKTQIDISTNLELGKFFGDKSGIKIPMYAQYSKTVFRPEFDPYDKDV